MRFWHTATSPAWVRAQGMEGQTVESALHDLRGGFEPGLRRRRDRVETKRGHAEALADTLSADPIELPDPAIKAERAIRAAEPELRAKFEAVRQAEGGLKAFKLHHGLDREPIEPEVLRNALILAIIVFGEAGINTGFFYTAHMVGGPLAALMVSFLISLTNVAVSASAGYFIGRWLNYGLHAMDGDRLTLRLLRLAIRCLFIASLTVVGFLHLTVGLVRSQESLDVIQHGVSAYWGLVTSPEAVFLVLTGLCMSALSFHKGRIAFADPYPGYGERYRAVLAAYDHLYDVKDDTADEVEAVFDDTLDEAGRGWKRQDRAINRHVKAVNACLSEQRRLAREVAGAEDAMRVQVARIAAQHRAAQGEEAPNVPDGLDHLSAFSSFLEAFDPPPFFHPPDRTAQKELWEAARAAALERLDALFAAVCHHEFEGEEP